MERKINISDIVRDDNGLVEVTNILSNDTIVGNILTRLPDDNFKHDVSRTIKTKNILGHTSPMKTIKDGRLKKYRKLK